LEQSFVSSNVDDTYNIASNTWTNAPLSQVRDLLAGTSVANRNALIAGGYNVKTSFSIVDIFNSLRRIWNTTTLSQPREALAATSLGNLAFFGGSDNGGSQTFNTFDIFNTTLQTWCTATLSQNRTWLAAPSLGYILAFGGGYNGTIFSAVVDMSNATSSIWFTANLSQARAYLAAISLTNKNFLSAGIAAEFQTLSIFLIFYFRHNQHLFPVRHRHLHHTLRRPFLPQRQVQYCQHFRQHRQQFPVQLNPFLSVHNIRTH